MLAPRAIFHGRYEVVRCIQAGGMGAVYEVTDTKTRRRRALKVMLPSLVADADFRARFQREATVTADIESEHIVETFDADVDPATGAPFLVMELLKGSDLGRLLERGGPLAQRSAIVLLRQAALALDRTHAAGVVHRDLKPENLFVTRSDDGWAKLKVLDFGIAKVVESAGQARNTRAMGTPLYMAPEQIRGDGGIDARADLFSLAHIAYALVSGEAYWAEDAAEAPALFALFSRMMLGLKEAPSARAARRSQVALPEPFDAWLTRGVAFEPSARFESATTMIEELAAVFGVEDGARASFDAMDRRASSRPPSSALATPESVPQATPTKISGPQGTAVLSEAPPTRTTGAVSSDRGEKREERARRSTWPVAVAALAVVATLGVGAVFKVRSRVRPAAAAPTSAASEAPPIAPEVGRPEITPASPLPEATAASTTAATAPTATPHSKAGTSPHVPAHQLRAAPSAISAPPPQPTFDPTRER